MHNDTTTELSLSSLEIGKLEACVELMFLAARADGHIDASERAAFQAQVLAAGQGQLKPELIEQIFEQLVTRPTRGTRAQRFEEIRRRIGDPKLRRAILSAAVEMVVADGKVVGAEHVFLKEAADALGIAADEVEQMLAAARR